MQASRTVSYTHLITVVGERINPTGKKRFQQALREEDMNYVLEQAVSQVEAGAQVLDVNVGAPGVDEPALMPKVVKALQSVTSLPLQLDSSNAVSYTHLDVYKRQPLGIALGKDIAGVAQVADLCKMPHLLIAGSTGSGKSVCVNSIIMSLLFRSSPEDVKLLLIDPKVVELAEYNGIPHLLMPVVTEPKKAAGALGSAVQEMERRYHLFAENNVRDIKSFNKLAAERPDLEKMPYIAIIIDELADLMMVVGKDVEDSICRIAQKARAAGMHLSLIHI